MRKIKVKTLYLIAIVVGGLIGLATKSTYAIFTSSAEIDNPICMATNLTSEEEVVDTMDVVVASGEVKEVPITISNTSNSTLNYIVFYNSASTEIEIGINMKASDSSNSFGVINNNETKKVYVQIKNNFTSSIMVTLGVMSNIMSSDMNIVPSGKEGEAGINTGANLVEYITNLYTSSSKTSITAADSITYNYATSVSLMNDRLGSTSTGIDAGNIRYYGSSPNNYIYFNCSDYSNQSSSTCEKWRIIGVFDGKVKIMRNEIIGSFSWDNKNRTTGAENNYGKNDWTTARLMKLLNPSDYYTIDSNDNGYGQSLYWNRQSGTCFAGLNNATTSCDFTSSGLNDTTKNMISEGTWYLRGWVNGIYPSVAYKNERISGSVYSGRLTSWVGKVALPYSSDYGYASNLSECKSTLNSYNAGTCTGSNWMKNIITNNGNKKGLLLTPHAETSNDAWICQTSGALFYGDGDSAYASGVAPVLYLDSNISIKEDTDGTTSNPYQIVL